MSRNTSLSIIIPCYARVMHTLSNVEAFIIFMQATPTVIFINCTYARLRH